MNVIEWNARNIEGSADRVAYWVTTTREGRLNWKPSADPESKTRSVLEQIDECINANYRIAAMLSGETPPAPAAAPTSAGEASDKLIASAKALATVVRELDEASLARELQTPMGSLPGAVLAGIAAMNMVYHGGQINFIQCLYGDTEWRPSPPAV
jgi:hypothetical protein